MKTFTLIVGQSADGAIVGMRKKGDGGLDFGTLTPNYIGDDMVLITEFHADASGVTMALEGGVKFDNKASIDIENGVGATITLTWDGAKKAYYHAGSYVFDSIHENFYDVFNLKNGSGQVAPPIPNDTTFVSAAVITNPNPDASGTGVKVTLSDANGYASITSEWQVKINGTVKPLVGVDGHNTTVFTLGFNQAGTIKAGDVVLVSHLVADSGIKKFIDKPVTNSLA